MNCKNCRNPYNCKFSGKDNAAANSCDDYRKKSEPVGLTSAHRGVCGTCYHYSKKERVCSREDPSFKPENGQLERADRTPNDAACDDYHAAPSWQACPSCGRAYTDRGFCLSCETSKGKPGEIGNEEIETIAWRANPWAK